MITTESCNGCIHEDACDLMCRRGVEFADLYEAKTPPIKEGYRKLKHGELVHHARDLRWDGEYWVPAAGGKQNITGCTYIRKLPEEQDDGCLPGHQKVEVLGKSNWLYYVPPDSEYQMDLDELVGDPYWSGRYGYKYLAYGKEPTIFWCNSSRIYRNKEGEIAKESGMSCFQDHTDLDIPVLPGWVEMKEGK